MGSAFVSIDCGRSLTLVLISERIDRIRLHTGYYATIGRWLAETEGSITRILR